MSKRRDEPPKEPFEIRGYGINAISPICHVATELDAAPSGVASIAAMAKSMKNVNGPDIRRVKSNEGLANDDEAREWLVGFAIHEMNKDGHPRKRIVVDGDTATLRVKSSTLTYKGRTVPLLFDDSQEYRSPYDPTSGGLAKNPARAKLPPSDEELRKSLIANGWDPASPGVRVPRYPDKTPDSDDPAAWIVISGNRRWKIAREEGISPVWLDVDDLVFNTSDLVARDKAIARAAVAANLGGTNITNKDREHVARELYATGEWTQDELASMLTTPRTTITDWVADVDVKRRSTADRRREVKALHATGGWSIRDLAAKFNVTIGTIQKDLKSTDAYTFDESVKGIRSEVPDPVPVPVIETPPVIEAPEAPVEAAVAPPVVEAPDVPLEAPKAAEAEPRICECCGQVIP